MLKCGTCKVESNSEVLAEPAFTLSLPVYDMKKTQPKRGDRVVLFEYRGPFLWIKSGHTSVTGALEEVIETYSFWAPFPNELAAIIPQPDYEEAKARVQAKQANYKE